MICVRIFAPFLSKQPLKISCVYCITLLFYKVFNSLLFFVRCSLYMFFNSFSGHSCGSHSVFKWLFNSIMLIHSKLWLNLIEHKFITFNSFDGWVDICFKVDLSWHRMLRLIFILLILDFIFGFGIFCATLFLSLQSIGWCQPASWLWNNVCAHSTLEVVSA